MPHACMALQNKLNDLKQGPKEDKVAVASGVAVSVVFVLLAAWTIYFLHQIQNGSQQLYLGNSQFNSDTMNQAQQQLQQQLGSSTADLQAVQQQLSAQGGSVQMQTQEMQIQGQTGASPFGGSGQ